MAKNLISGDTTTIIESGNDIAVDLNSTYGDYINIDGGLSTSANNLTDGINENKSTLQNMIYVKSSTLGTNMTINANTNTPTAYVDLEPLDGYEPIVAIWHNTWGGQVVLWFLNVFYEEASQKWRLAWRARNVTSSQITGITIIAKVIYVKKECYMGDIS